MPGNQPTRRISGLTLRRGIRKSCNASSLISSCQTTPTRQEKWKRLPRQSAPATPLEHVKRHRSSTFVNPDESTDCTEALPQEWCFLEEVQAQIQKLEIEEFLPPLAPLYLKPRPKDIQQLTIDAFHLSIGALPYLDGHELYSYNTSLTTDLDVHEPTTYQQAMNSPQRDSWMDAINDEMASHHKSDTWEIVTRTADMNVLSGKWVFRVKRGPNGRIQRFKARWVVRGFEQQQGIDYNETFASVVRQKTYRVLFALAAIHDWEIEQMDVKTAFLYGDIDEEVYVELPTGREQPGKVCKLRKAL